MILFAFEAYQAMAEALAKSSHMALGRFLVSRFENRELHAEIQTLVRKENCFVLGSIAPPDEQLLSTLLLAHTLRNEGACRVTALLPIWPTPETIKTSQAKASQRPGLVHSRKLPDSTR